MKETQPKGRIKLSKRVKKEGLVDPFDTIGELKPINLNKTSDVHEETASDLKIDLNKQNATEDACDDLPSDSLDNLKSGDSKADESPNSKEIEIPTGMLVNIFIAFVIMFGVMKVGDNLSESVFGSEEKSEEKNYVFKVETKKLSYHYCTPWSPKPETINRNLSFTQIKTCADFENGELINKENKQRNAIGSKKIINAKKPLSSYEYGPWQNNKRVYRLFENGKLISEEIQHRGSSKKKFIPKDKDKKNTKSNISKGTEISQINELALKIKGVLVSNIFDYKDYSFVHSGFKYQIPNIKSNIKGPFSDSVSELNDSFSIGINGLDRKACQLIVRDAGKTNHVTKIMIDGRLVVFKGMINGVSVDEFKSWGSISACERFNNNIRITYQ